MEPHVGSGPGARGEGVSMWRELLGQKRSPTRCLGRPQRSRCWGLGARRCVWQSPAFARISRVTSRMRAGLSRGTQERDRRGHRGPGRPCVLQAQPGAAGRLVLGHGDSEAACLSLLQPQQLQPHVRGHKRFHRHVEGQMPLSAWTGSKRQRTCRRRAPGSAGRRGRARDLWTCLPRAPFRAHCRPVRRVFTRPLTRVCLLMLGDVRVCLSTC